MPLARFLQKALAAALLSILLAGSLVEAALPDTRKVNFSISLVVENPSSESSAVTLKTPLLAGEPSPYQENLATNLGPYWVETDPEEELGSFKVTVPAGQTRQVTQTYTLLLKPYSPPKEAPDPLTPEEKDRYLQAQPMIEVENSQIQSLAKRLVRSTDSPSVKADKILRFVRQKLRYSLSSPAANKGAVAALEAQSGICTEYTSLFVALMRASDVPSRIVNGQILLDSKRQPAKGAWKTAERHQWAEFFDPEKGWVPVDPTFASSVAASHQTPAYIVENYGDRPTKGSFVGGRVEVSFIYQVVPTE
ncbi:MAG: transglutaminase family protein [Bacillota bacterium]|nr:transglutaminase family protein [Bacillota bacterium]